MAEPRRVIAYKAKKKPAEAKGKPKKKPELSKLVSFAGSF